MQEMGMEVEEGCTMTKQLSQDFRIIGAAKFSIQIFSFI
jgi:hypothetical protein